MTMRIFSRGTLRDYWEAHPTTEGQLKAWFADVKNSNWKKPADLKQAYATVSLIGDNRAVFNIKGNKYRIVVKINYQKGFVFIRFIGTHAEYDEIDAGTI